MGRDSIRYVVVCFSLYSDKSLLYRKCSNVEEILDSVKKCIEKGAHVMSIRMFIEVEKSGSEKERMSLMKFLNSK